MLDYVQDFVFPAYFDYSEHVFDIHMVLEAFWKLENAESVRTVSRKTVESVILV